MTDKFSKLFLIIFTFDTVQYTYENVLKKIKIIFACPKVKTIMLDYSTQWRSLYKVKKYLQFQNKVKKYLLYTKHKSNCERNKQYIRYNLYHFDICTNFFLS